LYIIRAIFAKFYYPHAENINFLYTKIEELYLLAQASAGQKTILEADRKTAELHKAPASQIRGTVLSLLLF